jgi:hypothetical protein
MNYLASIKVYGEPTIWTLSHLEGQTDEERAIEIHQYLYNMGVRFYQVIHYAPMVVHSIAIEDIYLN